jgi:surface polysaccharide O-acyltransferase-like enzyme
MEEIYDSKKDHNYGIDLVKIVSMIFVAVLHVLGQGGILNGCRPLSAQYETAWFIEIAAYCAVNCFALASGYLLFSHRFKIRRIVVLWLQVVFYTVLITYIFSKVRPAVVTGVEWRNAVLPVLSNQYWYFTAYVGMFFLTPFLNYGVESMDRHELRKLLIALFVVFSLIPTIRQHDIFGTDNGYSVIWLALLYCAGAYIRKYTIEDHINCGVCIAVYAGCSAFVWLSKRQLDLYPLILYGTKIRPNVFVSYTSPFIILESAALFLAFARFTCRNRVCTGIISFFSPLAFSVYLIHTNPLVWDYVMKFRYEKYIKLPFQIMTFRLCGSALCIWFLCSIADLPRYWLFRLIKSAAVHSRHRCK